MGIIEVNNLKYFYNEDMSGEVLALDDVSFSVEEGEFIALLGANGSGKSTLAKLLNGLLYPSGGSVKICGLDTTDDAKIFELRKNIGVVFQNPDNQMVATVIEDDIAFGPENLGLPPHEINRRVDWALSCVGMKEHRKGTPFRLSGGQKQRIAIAGVLAIKPRILVLDESTAMLDPRGRGEVLSVIKDLVKKEKITVIMITHFPEEAAQSDRVIVLSRGKIAADGSAAAVLGDVEGLRRIGLDAPLSSRVAYSLRQAGVPLAGGIITPEQLAAAVTENGTAATKTKSDRRTESTKEVITPELCPRPRETECASVEIKNLSYVYSPNSPFSEMALKGVSLTVEDGDFFGIIGHTGSGKSTLINHINALIRVQKGKYKTGGARRLINTNVRLTALGLDLTAKKPDLATLRRKVGMVFQYPEYQLFADTVYDDVAFGPKNMKLPDDQIPALVRDAIERVGLNFEDVRDRSPFELSGGQKRRAAIAGIIAMKPELLILDEPTAGLDPQGAKEILELVRSLKATTPIVIMVSHNMDEIAACCNKVAVMCGGTVKLTLAPKDLFGSEEQITGLGLELPNVSRLAKMLAADGMDVGNPLTEAELVGGIKGGLGI